MIYLDHHAATPLRAVAEEAMHAARDRAWANPSSVHAAGRAARALLETARAQVAEALGSRAADVVLTSGGTEACNLGVRGLVGSSGASGAVLTSMLEHPAVRVTAEAVGRVTWLPCAADAWPNPEEVASRLGPGDLLAVQWVNHETGVILPVREWAELARARGARVFVDATQALGKWPLNVAESPFDAVAVAGQKIGGPTGTGALWVRRGVELGSVATGGGQERGRRAGTQNVLGHVGFGAACAEALASAAQLERAAGLRDQLEEHACSLGGVVNGLPLPRVSNVTQVAFPGQRADVLVAALDVEGVCASAGAACSSGLTEPVAALLALHPGEPWRATSSVRFSLAPSTTQEEISLACAALGRVLSRS
ncbi:MAG: aminotransferase class V-fold PLP-dependent enzyme [Myxococcales bacterium]|nr:aminotransferase class V-fold PLP-dependent enzyme [Myxococcales bacterium]MCB9627079.1 aminotransferase class V-fold PLP-dependent enzyme [Sandaracinaceae bacterium]